LCCVHAWWTHVRCVVCKKLKSCFLKYFFHILNILVNSFKMVPQTHLHTSNLRCVLCPTQHTSRVFQLCNTAGTHVKCVVSNTRHTSNLRCVGVFVVPFWSYCLDCYFSAVNFSKKPCLKKNTRHTWHNTRHHWPPRTEAAPGFNLFS